MAPFGCQDRFRFSAESVDTAPNAHKMFLPLNADSGLFFSLNEWDASGPVSPYFVSSLFHSSVTVFILAILFYCNKLKWVVFKLFFVHKKVIFFKHVLIYIIFYRKRLHLESEYTILAKRFHKVILIHLLKRLKRFTENLDPYQTNPIYNSRDFLPLLNWATVPFI